jgi:hypothetical protein
MFGSTVLEVAIGLVFVYLLFSLTCSAAKEGLEALIEKRAIDLERGVRELLNDPDGTDMAAKLYRHPLIDGLFQGTFDAEKGGRLWSNLPSYIPSENFALALIDVIHADQPDVAAHPLQALRSGIDAIQNVQVKRALQTLVNAAADDMNQVRADIEAWFNNAMDRVSGWYKRWSQSVIFVLGLLLVVILNADTIAIANNLAQDPSVRQALVAAAEESVKKQTPDAKDSQGLTATIDQMRHLGLSIGWDRNDPRRWPGPSFWDWFTKAIGLLLTAFAISLGAPFWFDVLNKFMFVRSTLKPKEKAKS